MKSFARYCQIFSLLVLFAGCANFLADSTSSLNASPVYRTQVCVFSLPDSVGDGPKGTITRTKHIEQIPFVVEYDVDLDADGFELVWVCIETGEVQNGDHAGFVLLSNLDSYSVWLTAEDSQGNRFTWIDDDIEFLLHSQTEILLNALELAPDDDIAEIQWSAENGDPEDAFTFPIQDSNESLAALTSDWPSVLSVRCDITKADGSTVTVVLDAMILFRQGSPFEIRSAAAFMPATVETEAILEIGPRMFADLKDLGFNTIIVHPGWFHSYPDEEGDFHIRPFRHDPQEERLPGMTDTPTDEVCAALVEEAARWGFEVQIELHFGPYRYDSELTSQYPGWGGGPNKGFMTSDGFLYGDGEGLEHYYLHYLPLIVEHSNVTAVFFSRECDYLANEAGEKSRAFHREIIRKYREAGYQGAISAAPSAYRRTEWYIWDKLLDDPPSNGLPFEDFDYIATTLYQPLATEDGASTEEMYRSAVAYRDRYLRRFHMLYDKAYFAEDFYCYFHDGCSIEPIYPNWGPDLAFDIEEARRWTTAWLRAFADIGTNSTDSWLAGLTPAIYRIPPERWKLIWNRGQDDFKPNINPEFGHETLRNLIKAYFRDEPVGIGIQEFAEARWLNPTERKEHLEAVIASFPKLLHSEGFLSDAERTPFCAKILDNFEESSDSDDGGKWTVEGHRNATWDLTTEEGDENHFLQLEYDYKEDNWIRLQFGRFADLWNAVEADGIQVTLWADGFTAVDVTIDVDSPSTGWTSWRLTNLCVAGEPERFKLPFSRFVSQSTGAIGIPSADIGHVVELSFSPRRDPPVAASLYLDDLCLYQVPKD